ncbi:DUF2478 domain-containing protein [Roseovarius sp. D22-M7]|uniref:DUF2478 domain-containing protein n=1 Tax=Roseovarius sp. D22-M7 TaxID=3127116 RepID=UPI0030101957
MHIGYLSAEGVGDTDLLLRDLATRAAARGLRLCGTVQINSGCAPDRPCDMDVRILPDGPVIRISQSLGPGARGCRLDPDALETAVAQAAARLAAGCDLVIVNKFGKQEADGRGFRDLIAEALGADVPVLVGVNRRNLAAFETFTGGQAAPVAAERGALDAWLDALTREARTG